MKIRDLINNDLYLEADIVIEEVDGETGRAIKRWESWENDPLPFELENEDVGYMTIATGYIPNYPTCPVLVIEY